MGAKISQQEKDSVAYFLEKTYLAAALFNDLYSFHKEFNANSRAGTLDMIHNAIAILMSGYGYTEKESEDILKQEILHLEKEALEEYHAWQEGASGVSEELRYYVISSILTVGGTNYFTAHSPHYAPTDLTTTADDRAKLIAAPSDDLHILEGYPPPSAIGLNGHIERPKQEPEVVPLAYGTHNPSRHPPQKEYFSPGFDISRPFRKASAKEVSISLTIRNMVGTIEITVFRIANN